MTEKLLEEVFQKARGEGAPDTALGLATHINKELEGKCQQPTTADSIRGYYRKLEHKEPFNISKTAKDHLAIYLGFKDYKDYLEDTKTTVVSTKKYQIALLLLIIVVAFFAYNATQKKCMIWDEDHFVKIHCEEANAKPIDQGLLNNFKKIEAECTEDFFFNKDNSAKVWYYKRGDKDLELFNSPGIHPVNGKTLHEITAYMINAHICQTLQ